MRIEVLDLATEDLLDGHDFYEKQAAGLGNYFLDSLFSDIESLLLYAGIHPIVQGKHRALSKRFPYAIYYTVASDLVRVHSVLDCRRNPRWTRRRLRPS